MNVAHGLRDIEGIGSITEGRLESLGIETLGDLATSDPPELHRRLRGLMTVSLEQVRTWIGAAQALLLTLSDQEGTARTAEAGLRRESFLVSLVFDAQGLVTRATVRDLRSRKRQSWTGWSDDSIRGFIEECLDLQLDRQPDEEVVDAHPPAVESQRPRQRTPRPTDQESYVVGASGARVRIPLSHLGAPGTETPISATARRVGDPASTDLVCSVALVDEGTVEVELPPAGDHKGLYQVKVAVGASTNQS